MQYPDWLIINDSIDSPFGLALVESKFELAQRILEACQCQLKVASALEVFRELESRMRACGLLKRTIESKNCAAVQFLLDRSIDVNPPARFGFARTFK